MSLVGGFEGSSGGFCRNRFPGMADPCVGKFHCERSVDTHMNAIHLYRDGDYVVVSVEVEKHWVPVIREFIGSPFSHIVEPSGIQRCAYEQKDNPFDRTSLPFNLQILTDEELQELRAEARTTVLAELSKAARDEYLQKMIKEARSDHIADEEVLHVQIEVAPWSPGMMIDGTQYFHGYTYQVKSLLACVLFEQMWRTWGTSGSIGWKRSGQRSYRRPRNVMLGPHNINTPNSVLLAV